MTDKEKYEEFKDLGIRLMALSYGLDSCLEKFQDLLIKEFDIEKINFSELLKKGTH